MTRNCYNVMRKIADSDGTNPEGITPSLRVMRGANPSNAMVRQIEEEYNALLRPNQPSFIRNVGSNLRRLYNNPEETAKNFQAAQQRALAKQQKALNYFYNQGNRVAPRINQEAGHIASRVVPALGQIGGTLHSSARDTHNLVADFANKVGKGWGGKLAENVGKHARTAGDAFFREMDKWDIAGAMNAADRSAKSLKGLGKTLMTNFNRGYGQ